MAFNIKSKLRNMFNGLAGPLAFAATLGAAAALPACGESPDGQIGTAESALTTIVGTNPALFVVGGPITMMTQTVTVPPALSLFSSPVNSFTETFKITNLGTGGVNPSNQLAMQVVRSGPRTNPYHARITAVNGSALQTLFDVAVNPGDRIRFSYDSGAVSGFPHVEIERLNSPTFFGQQGLSFIGGNPPAFYSIPEVKFGLDTVANCVSEMPIANVSSLFPTLPYGFEQFNIDAGYTSQGFTHGVVAQPPAGVNNSVSPGNCALTIGTTISPDGTVGRSIITTIAPKTIKG